MSDMIKMLLFMVCFIFSAGDQHPLMMKDKDLPELNSILNLENSKTLRIENEEEELFTTWLLASDHEEEETPLVQENPQSLCAEEEEEEISNI